MPHTSPRHSTLPRHCNTLQHTATHCNTLQHTATHCNTLQYTAAHCNTLQHTATHCNTPQHTATHCNTQCPDPPLSLKCVCCSVLQCVAVCCFRPEVCVLQCVLQCVTVCVWCVLALTHTFRAENSQKSALSAFSIVNVAAN